MNILDIFENLFLKPKPVRIEVKPIVLPLKPKPIEPELNSKDIAKIKLLYPRIQSNATKFLIDVKKAGYNGGIFMSYRTFAEQDALYAQGRTKPGQIVTNARGGWSLHNYGLAIDFVFHDKNDNWTWDSNLWKQVGQIGINNGWESGYYWTSFPDKPHFQITFKPKNFTDIQWLEKLRTTYLKNNKIQDVWSFLDTLK